MLYNIFYSLDRAEIVMDAKRRTIIEHNPATIFIYPETKKNTGAATIENIAMPNQIPIARSFILMILFF